MGRCDASLSADVSSESLKLLISGTPKGQLLRIQLSVVSTIALLFLLLLLGSIRRRVRVGSFLKYATKIIYLLIPISITYIMGLMHNASCTHPLYPIWACALVYAYGGVVTMTACDLSDNDNTLQYFWRILPLLFWTVWLGIIVSNNKSPLLLFITLLWFLMYLIDASSNTKETLIALYRASKSNGLPHVVEPIVRYMREGKDVADEAVADPMLMRGYRYVVWGCPARDNIVTTEEIWQSVGVNFMVNCVGNRDGLMRDLCLSYALFRLVLRRFAGFPLHESLTTQRRQITMCFMREGLLSLEPQRVERLFRIIEVELDFLFDFFYTKLHVWNSYRVAKKARLWSAFQVAYFVVVVFTLQIYAPGKTAIIYNDAGVTRIVMIIFLLLGIWKHIKVHYSNRKMVWLLCTGLREIEAKRRRGIEKRISRIWGRKARVSRIRLLCFFSKPWQRRLGQYSFLKSYGRVPVLARKPFSRLGKLVKLPRTGQGGDYSVALSYQVKQQIVSSLLQNQLLAMSRGTTTIARYGLQLHGDIIDACELDTDAHTILVWHIAISFCEIDHAPKDNADPNYFVVATQLSKYCAYLMTFVPELLPSHPYTTEHLFDMAVEEAKRELIGTNMPQRNPNVSGRNVAPDEVVKRGYLLGQTLKREMLMQNPNRGWEFLAEFWAELLLYLAPSDNVYAHGEHLANGGEFITHLWALLTHAGVVSRD